MPRERGGRGAGAEEGAPPRGGRKKKAAAAPLPPGARTGRPGAASWSRACGHAGCTKKPAYALIGDAEGTRWCGAHAPPGSRDVVSRRCQHPGCFKKPNFGYEEKKGLWCRPHAPPDALDVVSRKCEHPGCTKQPHYGLEQRKARWCSLHAPDGSFDVMSKRCEVEGCRSKPQWGFESRKPRFCRAHAPPGTLRVAGQRCEHRSASGVRCAKFPKLADPAEPWRARWCSDHPPQGAVLADISKLPTVRPCAPSPSAATPAPPTPAPASPADSEAVPGAERGEAGPMQAAEALELLSARGIGRPPLRRQRARWERAGGGHQKQPSELEPKPKPKRRAKRGSSLPSEGSGPLPAEQPPPVASHGGESAASDAPPLISADIILPSRAIAPQVPLPAGPGMLECLLAGYILDNMVAAGGGSG